MRRLITTLVGLLLAFATAGSACAQGADWQTLTDQTRALYREGRVADAVGAARQALAAAEREKGAESPEVAVSLDNLGTLYMALGRYAEAEATYVRSLPMTEKDLGPDHPIVASALTSLAHAYRALGRFAQAEPLYARALAIREKTSGPDTAETATALNNLAAAYDSAGKYAEAEPLFLRALAIDEKGGRPAHAAKVLNNLAGSYLARGAYAQAEPLYLRSLAIIEKNQGADAPDLPPVLGSLASLYSAQGQYPKAEAAARRAVAISEKISGPEHPDLAFNLDGLGAILWAQGRYDEAEPLLQRALAIREKTLGPDHADTAKTLGNLAAVYLRQGQYARAEPLYRRVIANLEKSLGPEHPDLALPLSNLGGLYYYQGRYAAAEALYKRALAVRERALGPDHPAVAQTLASLAELYRAIGETADAEALYQRTLAIQEKGLGPDHPDLATTLNNLAALYTTLGQFPRAEPLFRRALAIQEKALGAGHADVGLSLANLGELYRATGRNADAEGYYLKALPILEKALGPEHPTLAKTLDNLGSMYLLERKYGEAGALYRRALAIQEKSLSPDDPDLGLMLSNLAQLNVMQGQYAAALPLSRRATALYARRALAGEGGAVRSEQRERRVYFEQALNILVNLPQTPESAAEGAEAIQLARASDTGAAVAQMAARFAAGSDELAGLIRRRQDLAARLAALGKQLLAQQSKPAAQRQAAFEASLRAGIASAAGEITALSATLAQRFPQYAELASARPLPLAEAQKLLAPDEALLAWAFGASEGYLLALRRDRAALIRLPAPLGELTADIAALRRALDPELPRPYPAEAAYRLYSQLLAPALPLIADAKHLFVVPAGPLESLPLSVLLTEAPADPANRMDGMALQGAPWLIRKWAVSTLPSISSLQALRVFAKASGATRPFLGIGDPLLDDHPSKGGTRTAAKTGARGVASANLFRGGASDLRAIGALPSLPESADELAAMAKSLGAGGDTLMLRAGATETAVKQQTLANDRVIAFATHGAVAGDIVGLAEPALVLTPPKQPTELDDGLLTASEIAQLKLDADWVILSACNTAAGDGTPGAEGLSGLAKAFIYAGARTLLVSHWPVASAPTVAITTRMLRESAKPGIGRAEAHRLSMLAYLNDPANADALHPAYWAPFAVIGEGGVAGR